MCSEVNLYKPLCSPTIEAKVIKLVLTLLAYWFTLLREPPFVRIFTVIIATKTVTIIEHLICSRYGVTSFPFTIALTLPNSLLPNNMRNVLLSLFWR